MPTEEISETDVRHIVFMGASLGASMAFGISTLFNAWFESMSLVVTAAAFAFGILWLARESIILKERFGAESNGV